MIKNKRCGRCKKSQPTANFNKDVSRRDGYCNKCKGCTKEYRDSNKESMKIYQKKYRKNNSYKFATYRPKNHKSIVYFALLDGYVKVGFTTNLKTRINTLTTKELRHPTAKGKVKLLGNMWGGREEELILHEKFKDIRHGNTEWFLATPELLEFASKEKVINHNPKVRAKTK